MFFSYSSVSLSLSNFELAPVAVVKSDTEPKHYVEETEIRTEIRIGSPVEHSQEALLATRGLTKLLRQRLRLKRRCNSAYPQ